MLRNLIISVLLVCYVGCRRGDASEEECVKNLKILNLAAKSYALDKGITNSAVIDPRELVDFLKEGGVPTCPLGNAPYRSFVLISGPSCPNNPAHTAKFTETKDKTANGRPMKEKSCLAAR